MARTPSADGYPTMYLALLADGPAHGYVLVQRLAERTAHEMQIPAGLVYSVLHELEQQGLVEAHWAPGAPGRGRRGPVGGSTTSPAGAGSWPSAGGSGGGIVARWTWFCSGARGRGRGWQPVSDERWATALEWQAYIEEATADIRDNAEAEAAREALRAHLVDQSALAAEGSSPAEAAREAPAQPWPPGAASLPPAGEPSWRGSPHRSPPDGCGISP